MEHGPAMMVRLPLPTSVPRTSMTVSSGCHSRDVSLKGRLIGVTTSTPGMTESLLIRTSLTGATSPRTAITTRWVP